MADVAQAAGVSTSTISHVVNRTRYVDPATVDRVKAEIDRLGYRHNQLARSVARGGRTQSIGVAMSARSNPYFGDVVSAIDTAATAHGSTILLGETADDPDRELALVENLLQRRVDGIIIAPGPHAAEPGQTLPLLAKSAARTVLIDRIHPQLPFDQVGTDNVEPVAALVEHLAATHGHRRIGFIAGLPGLATTEERLTGYRLGMRRAGADLDTDLVQIGGSSREGGETATTTLLALDVPPTALIAGNNAMTVGMLRTLNRSRVAVPTQMAIAGFDDFEWADLLVAPLTAIAQDWERIGTRAVELLIRGLDAPTPSAHIIERTPTQLQVRRSCGCTGTPRTVPIPLG